MINRQRALLRFVANEGGQIEMLRLVKLAFLLRESSESIPQSVLYEFFPYHYGPFSFTLNHELRAAERDGWIRISESGVHQLRDTRDEMARMDPNTTREVDSLSRRNRNVSTKNLVSRIYAQYPWYTSKAKDSKLRGANVPNTSPAVFTVGYEGLMLDGLLDLLLQSGIRHLIDVRKNPIARRFGFHKSTLERCCLDVGIIYTHVPELGIPSEKRADLDSAQAYFKLFNYYEKEILPTQGAAVDIVCSFVKAKPSALMCMEADDGNCHRSRLAKVVAQITQLTMKELRSP